MLAVSGVNIVIAGNAKTKSTRTHFVDVVRIFLRTLWIFFRATREPANNRDGYYAGERCDCRGRASKGQISGNPDELPLEVTNRSGNP